jgi:ABC-2 type transport system permease protein
MTATDRPPVAAGREARQWPALWRLEWWRLVRTHRIVALLATYVFFGATAAPMARYAGELVQRFGGGVQVTMPPTRPVDGFTNYISNTNQLGLLVFVMVISSALTLDAHREMAVFMRTRVRHPRDLVLPRYAVNLAAAVASFVVGALCTWYGTALLLGPVDAGGVAIGVVLQVAYLACIGAVAAALGVRLRSAMTTAAATLGLALVLAILGAIEPLGAWLPSSLLGALSTLPAGADASTFARPLAVTIGVTVVLLVAAVRGARARRR